MGAARRQRLVRGRRVRPRGTQTPGTTVHRGKLQIAQLRYQSVGTG